MTIFNTKLAKELCGNNRSSFEILEAIAKFANSDLVPQLAQDVIIGDFYNIIDDSARHGAYQVFMTGPRISLCVNGWKLQVVKIPFFNKIIFVLQDKKGFSKTTSDATAVRNFVMRVISDKDNRKMFK